MLYGISFGLLFCRYESLPISDSLYGSSELVVVQSGFPMVPPFLRTVPFLRLVAAVNEILFPDKLCPKWRFVI